MELLDCLAFSDYVVARNYSLSDLSFSSPLDEERIGISSSECCLLEIDYGALTADFTNSPGHKIVLSIAAMGRNALLRCNVRSLETNNEYVSIFNS